MGTASQSVKDPQDAADFKRMEEATANDADRKKRLGQAIRNAMNEALKGRALADIKDRVNYEIQKKVKDEVVKKFMEWEKDPSKPWPFP